METAYSANDYRFYLEHSWGTSPAQKLREKEYNKAYYEAHKSKWGVDGAFQRKTQPSNDPSAVQFIRNNMNNISTNEWNKAMRALEHELSIRNAAKELTASKEYQEYQTSQKKLKEIRSEFEKSRNLHGGNHDTDYEFDKYISSNKEISDLQKENLKLYDAYLAKQKEVVNKIVGEHGSEQADGTPIRAIVTSAINNDIKNSPIETKADKQLIDKTRELKEFVPTTDKEKEGAAKLITKDLNHLDKERAKAQYKVNEALAQYERMVAKANRAKTDEKHDKLNRKADEFLNSRSKDFNNLEKINSRIDKALKDAEDIGLTVDTKDTKRLAESVSSIVAKSAVNLLTVPLTGTVVVPGATSINGTKYKVKYDKDKKNAEQDAEFAKRSTEVSEASTKATNASLALDDYRTRREEELTPKYIKEYEKRFNKKYDHNDDQATDWVKGSIRDELGRTNDAKYSKLNDEYMKATEDYQRKKQDFDNWSKESEKQESKYKTPEAVTKAVNAAKARGDEKEAKRLTNLYKEESAHKEKMANAPSDKKESKYETSEWKEQARKALANAKKNDRYDINFLETVQNDDYSTQKLLIEYEKYLKNPEKYMQTH